MSYCTNCGQQLHEGNDFCPNCGKEVKDQVKNAFDSCNYSYNGELHKCPNCGESLASFTIKCPSCGYELRGAKVSSSIQQFTCSLEHAENNEQRANLIRSFPIPNTKEDIFEYIILASTNIVGEPHAVVFDAWVTKFEQCYHKAKYTLIDDPDFEKIKNVYEKTSKDIAIERAKHGMRSFKNLVKKYFSIMPSPVFGIIVILLVILSVIRLFKGKFSGIDLIFASLILCPTYFITKKKSKKNN